MKVWVLCEAFVLTCDESLHDRSLTPWSVVCANREACKRELKRAVGERVKDNYFGIDKDDVDELIKSDVKEVLEHGEAIDDEAGLGEMEYFYDGGDRIVKWRFYPCEVIK